MHSCTDWHQLHLRMHQRFPEHLYIAWANMSGGSMSGQQYCPVYYSNIFFRLLPVIELIIYRIIEVEPPLSAVVNLVPSVGPLFRFHRKSFMITDFCALIHSFCCQRCAMVLFRKFETKNNCLWNELSFHALLFWKVVYLLFLPQFHLEVLTNVAAKSFLEIIPMLWFYHKHAVAGICLSFKLFLSHLFRSWLSVFSFQYRFSSFYATKQSEGLQAGELFYHSLLWKFCHLLNIVQP